MSLYRCPNCGATVAAYRFEVYASTNRPDGTTGTAKAILGPVTCDCAGYEMSRELPPTAASERTDDQHDQQHDEQQPNHTADPSNEEHVFTPSLEPGEQLRDDRVNPGVRTGPENDADQDQHDPDYQQDARHERPDDRQDDPENNHTQGTAR